MREFRALETTSDLSNWSDQDTQNSVGINLPQASPRPTADRHARSHHQRHALPAPKPVRTQPSWLGTVAKKLELRKEFFSFRVAPSSNDLDQPLTYFPNLLNPLNTRQGEIFERNHRPYIRLITKIRTQEY